jgi:hypothetical protein
MAALTGYLEALWCHLVKLLPCVDRSVINDDCLREPELIHRMLVNTGLIRELSTTRPVYPGVEQRCVDAIGAFPYAD